MTTAEDFASGKGSTQENFPVASVLIAPRHRAPILAFYRFARAADDVADHADLLPERKIALLDRMQSTLLGENDDDPAALPLRAALRARGLTPVHALDLLVAFRQDATKTRYADWGELMRYCRYSAMPVGRFVLDVHGESAEIWPANDALCAALQIINHLQDCGKDYRTLDRVYLPLDTLAAHKIDVEVLAQSRASSGLRSCLSALVAQTAALLPQAAELPPRVRDLRLSMETAAIVALARRLVAILRTADPLCERVHLGKAAAAATAGAAAARMLVRRLLGSGVISAARGAQR